MSDRTSRQHERRKSQLKHQRWSLSELAKNFLKISDIISNPESIKDWVNEDNWTYFCGWYTENINSETCETELNQSWSHVATANFLFLLWLLKHVRSELERSPDHEIVDEAKEIIWLAEQEFLAWDDELIAEVIQDGGSYYSVFSKAVGSAAEYSSILKRVAAKIATKVDLILAKNINRPEPLVKREKWDIEEFSMKDLKEFLGVTNAVVRKYLPEDVTPATRGQRNWSITREQAIQLFKICIRDTTENWQREQAKTALHMLE